MNKVKAIDTMTLLRCTFGAALATLIVVTAASDALAQDPSQVDYYDQPYGLGYGDENRPYTASTRDANGNRVIVNGRFVYQSSYSATSGVGGYSLTGQWGANFSASAIGNSLNVVTNGNNNTVIVDSTQINNGDQEAEIVLNGDIDFGD